MNKSNTLEYVHPDYLTIDNALDHIGKATFEDWDSGYIEKSRIHDQIIGTQADGSKRGLPLISMKLFIPNDEAKIRTILRDFKPKIAPQEALPSTCIDAYEFSMQIISLIGPDQVDVSKSTKKFNLEIKEDRVNLSNILNLTKTINTLRDSLVLDELCLYVKYDGEYKKICPANWEDQNHWNRLLIEGYFRDKPLKGNVYFFKKDVKAFLENNLQALPCTDSQQSKEMLEKLLNPKRPWLKLINELTLSLLDSEVETMIKKQLINVIDTKARSLGLSPSKNKLEFIATLLRTPEQEKGTAYRSMKEKENPKPKKQKQKSTKK